MELGKELVESLGLTGDQVKGITDFGTSHIAELKQTWDGKANENAEKIIGGAITSAQKSFKVDLPRNQGEKYSDYLSRLSSHIVTADKTAMETAKAEYEQKLADFKGGDDVKAELEGLKAKYDEALKKYADYDALKESAEKATEYEGQLSTLKLEVAFNGVKPAFPEGTNQYEADAKWNEFKANVLKDNTIELVDGKPVAISKENIHAQKSLSDLLGKDEAIQSLLQGRKQKGTGGADPVDLKTVEGVPFKVPADADAKTRSKLIRDYLTEKGISPASSNYSEKFAELNSKLIKAKTPAA